MSGLTMYLLQDGVTDLSFVFQNGTTSTKSNYLLQDGRDLSDLFAPFSNKTANLTGYITNTGIDLNQLFNGIINFTFTFTVSLTTTVIIGAVTTANNGVGYISLFGSTFRKTTNSGSSWASLTSGGNRGISTNSENTMLVQGDANSYISYSTNGGVSWSNGGGSTATQACFIPRSVVNNPIIFNRNAIAALYFSSGTYGTITTITTANVVSNVSSAACISDASNYIYVNYIPNGSKVYRNTTNGNLTSGLTVMTSSVSLGTEVNNLFSSCCNTDNTVNLIVGRPGTIYRSTTWNGTFTRIANSPYANFQSVSTSSSGRIVCAVSYTAIYISNDKGITFTIATIPALLTNELLYWSSVSPDEKFILVSTYISTTSARAFICLL
jgi:hypothetical protein